MKKLVIIGSILAAGMSVQAQSAHIMTGSESAAPIKSSGVTVAATGTDLSKEETEAVHKLLNLTPTQYQKVYEIYVQKNERIESAKTKYASEPDKYAVEVSIATNSVDQFISQQLTADQQPKWMDVVRAKYKNNK